VKNSTALLISFFFFLFSLFTVCPFCATYHGEINYYSVQCLMSYFQSRVLRLGNSAQQLIYYIATVCSFEKISFRFVILCIYKM